MGCAPLALERLDFLVGEFLRLKFPPGPEAPHVSECKIASFPHVPLRTLFRVGARGHTEYSASRFTIRFVTRILCGIRRYASSFHCSPATHASTRDSIALKSAPIRT